MGQGMKKRKYRRVPGDLREPVEKVCMLCGKTFSTKRPQALLCSPECKRENRLRYGREHYVENREKYMEMAKAKRRAEYKPKGECILCGELVIQEWIGGVRGRRRMHDECIIEDTKKSIRNGMKLTSAQAQRLRARGITLTELKQEVMEETNGKAV